jgi:hypothetical protein
MLDESLTIYNLYESKALINNTTRNKDSYTYAPVEYSTSRNEANETSTRNLVQKLEKCVQYSKQADKESYTKLFFDLQKIIKELQSLIK